MSAQNQPQQAQQHAITIPLARHEIVAADMAAVLEVLRSERLSKGSRILDFESALCSVTEARYAVAVSSGTAALHLLMLAAGIGPGDEVITTPFTFIASSNCILYVGAKPVFVDVGEDMNLDPGLIAGALTPRTRAILPVHVFGHPCRMETITALADRAGIVVVEDACEALGARCSGKAVGSIGRGAAFGFAPNKQITAGEGGAIVTSDAEWAETFRSLRDQGRSATYSRRYDRLGYNYRLTEMQAALGASQLGRLPQILRRRAEVAAWYCDALQEVPEIVLPPAAPPQGENSWFSFVVRLVPRFHGEQRDRIVQDMAHAGIECANYFPPIHLQPFLQARFGFRRGDFPRAEAIAERTIALPFSTLMSREQVDCVVTALKHCLSRAAGTHAGPS